jgi:hypothetical protein
LEEPVKNYIVEISRVNGDESTIYLEADGESVDSLFAVIGIAECGACIVDTCYRSIAEAQVAWPEAIAPTPYNLTPEAIATNCTIEGKTPAKKLN